MQPGFDRPRRTAQDARHVRQRSVLKKAQQDDRADVFPAAGRRIPAAGWKFRSGPRLPPVTVPATGTFSCRAARSSRSKTGSQCQRQRPGAGAPRPFLAPMQQNGVEPGGKPATLIVARQAFPGLNKGFGHQVFRRADDRPHSATAWRSKRVWNGSGQTAKRLRVPARARARDSPALKDFEPVIRNVHLCINPRRPRKGSKIFAPNWQPGNVPTR